MLLVTAPLGWEPQERIGALVHSGSRREGPPGALPGPAVTAGTWLDLTRRGVSETIGEEATGRPWSARSGLWALLLVVAMAYLILVVLW